MFLLAKLYTPGRLSWEGNIMLLFLRTEAFTYFKAFLHAAHPKVQVPHYFVFVSVALGYDGAYRLKS